MTGRYVSREFYLFSSGVVTYVESLSVRSSYFIDTKTTYYEGITTKVLIPGIFLGPTITS